MVPPDPLTLTSRVKLRDGNYIPILGFGISENLEQCINQADILVTGTFELNDKDAYQAVTCALEAGYRHIDSASSYRNERETGQAILDFCKNSGVPRSDIFYTTKLKTNDGYDRTCQAIKSSLDACNLGYIDLYLIHGPLGGPRARLESWRAICDAQKAGTLKSIGISTFGVKHMEEMMESGLPLPAVHQIDLHPFMVRKDIVQFCKAHDIVLEAWAPLVKGLRFSHPTISALADKYKKEPAQVLLRYSLQKGYIPLPKSSSEYRIISNSQIFDFELLEEDTSALDALDEGLVTDWDPTGCP